jgi:hypothetical protein
MKKYWLLIAIAIVLLSCSMATAKQDTLQKFSEKVAKERLGSQLESVTVKGDHVTIVWESAHYKMGHKYDGEAAGYDCIGIFEKFKDRQGYKDVTCVVTFDNPSPIGIKFGGYKNVIMCDVIDQKRIQKTVWTTGTVLNILPANIKGILQYYYCEPSFTPYY